MSDEPKEITNISDLEPDSGNANKGTERGHTMLEQSLRELGAGRSILADKHGRVIAGNKTLEVAAGIGMENIVVVKTDGNQLVVVQRQDLDLETDPKARKLAIADNRVGEVNLSWDPGVLAAQMKIAPALAIGMFSDRERAKILALSTPQPILSTDAPVDPTLGQKLRAEKWATNYGQVWKVGRHRFMCGDSTNPDDAKRLVGDTPVALLVTSPPYWTGQEYDDKPGTESVKAFMENVSQVWKGVPRRRLVIQTGHTNSTLIGDGGPIRKILLDSMWADALVTSGWLLRSHRFWVKSGGLPQVSPIADMVDESVEVILTFYRPGFNEGGQERLGTNWSSTGYWDDIPGTSSQGHPCPFPAEIPRRVILLYSEPGDVVVDPFLGSGSTAVAAEQIDRICLGMELSPEYLAVALERMSTLGLPVSLEEAYEPTASS